MLDSTMHMAPPLSMTDGEAFHPELVESMLPMLAYLQTHMSSPFEHNRRKATRILCRTAIVRGSLPDLLALTGALLDLAMKGMDYSFPLAHDLRSVKFGGYGSRR